MFLPGLKRPQKKFRQGSAYISDFRKKNFGAKIQKRHKKSNIFQKIQQQNQVSPMFFAGTGNAWTPRHAFVDKDTLWALLLYGRTKNPMLAFVLAKTGLTWTPRCWYYHSDTLWTLVLSLRHSLDVVAFRQNQKLDFRLGIPCLNSLKWDSRQRHTLGFGDFLIGQKCEFILRFCLEYHAWTPWSGIRIKDTLWALVIF